MTTLREQLKDPIYRAWFARQPRRDENAPYKNWRVLVQKEAGGKWSRVDFSTWREGYTFVAKNIKKYHDMALISKLYPFRPPVVREKATGQKSYHFPVDALGELWCPFCRRMTEFKWFKRHHNMKAYLCGREPQCSICGAPLKFTNHPEWKY